MSEVIKLSKEELDALQEFKVKNDQIVFTIRSSRCSKSNTRRDKEE